MHQGIVGSTNSDLALDDLKITSGALCPDPGTACFFKCQNNTCLPQSKVCNFVNDCANGEDETQCGYRNITFENGFQGWNETSDGIFSCYNFLFLIFILE
jgi:hypothetical protein